MRIADRPAGLNPLPQAAQAAQAALGKPRARYAFSFDAGGPSHPAVRLGLVNSWPLAGGVSWTCAAHAIDLRHSP